MIGRSVERGSGISVLAARYDDDIYIERDKENRVKSYRLLVILVNLPLQYIEC